MKRELGEQIWEIILEAFEDLPGRPTKGILYIDPDLLCIFLRELPPAAQIRHSLEGQALETPYGSLKIKTKEWSFLIVPE